MCIRDRIFPHSIFKNCVLARDALPMYAGIARSRWFSVQCIQTPRPDCGFLMVYLGIAFSRLPRDSCTTHASATR
eukprot:616445-Pyramimonas_sp.AAC.1